jgi:alkanesulfonate monooxygenase SsuD/methylene tetrahydromethanopterin reductase-like flavin-dependent oxidoreductase (luciferase family)
VRLGLFMQPVHPLGRVFAETLAEDREAFVLADRLGFSEAFMGEHLADAAENIPSSLMFLASLVDSTTTMKLGTGVLNLPFSHPVIVATHVAMLDNMLKGRFLLGVGPGILRADAEALEVLDADREAMFEEALSHVLALWSSEAPYGLTGDYWNVSTERSLWPELGLGSMAKPFQSPHPPIIGASADPGSKRVRTFGPRGWHLISSDMTPAGRLAEQWGNYAEGWTETGKEADRDEWRVARSIFVCEDEKVAKAYGKADLHSPYRHYHEVQLTKIAHGRALRYLKADPDMPDEDVTLDYFVEECVIAGGVNDVIEQVLALHEQTGGFGTLVYAAKDWADPTLSRASMELLAEEVMPAVNAAIGSEATAV